MTLLVGDHIDWCHSHTGIGITDTGLKDFSAALGSSTTITAVTLYGKYISVWCVWTTVLFCVCGWMFGMWVDVIVCGGVQCVCVASA